MNSASPWRWQCVATEPGSCADPQELGATNRDWLPATVPGTAAGAMSTRLTRDELSRFDFDAADWWFVGTHEPGLGKRGGTIEFDGVATLSDVWVGDRHVAHNESMFQPFSVDVDEFDTVTIRCSSVKAALARRRPRGRWRSSLVAQQGLRWLRTTVLGRADLFAGVPAPVGPWREVRIAAHPKPVLSTRVEGDEGVLSLRLHVPRSTPGTTVQVQVGDRSFDVDPVSESLVDTEIRLPGVQLWWPHTHGSPHLHRVVVTSGETTVDCGSVGFRRIDVSRAEDGFALSLNGIRVFCRGACWVPIDPVTMNASPEDTRRQLELVTTAGFNMVRVTGTMVYENDTFWDLCAELGIMVWQDVMLATFDPPQTDEFNLAIQGEVRALLQPLAANPALTVISGGSETEQQPSMLGLAQADYAMPTLESLIPDVVSAIVPDVAYVTSSPSGPPGRAPIEVSTGVAHYFGIGGYLARLDSVQTAGVRFAAECLAFAIPPERSTVDAAFGSASVAGHHPAWKAAVPRDRGSSWDFEDVRDHYVREIFDVDPFAVRRVDPEKYLDFGRAAVCEAVSAAFSFWRRSDSLCDGALILTLRDVEDGAGWGLIDARGVPKAPWHTMRRLCAQRAITVADAGLDGLRVDVHNDAPEPFVGTVRLHNHGVAGRISETVEVPVDIPRHDSWSKMSSDLWQTFSDVSYSYRFGPPTSAGITAELVGEDGRVVSVDVFVSGRGPLQMQHSVGLNAVALRGSSGWTVEVTADAPAHFVAIEVAGFEPSDSWFHLLPGSARVIELRPLGGTDVPDRVRGHVRALNSVRESSIVLPSSQE